MLVFLSSNVKIMWSEVIGVDMGLGILEGLPGNKLRIQSGNGHPAVVMSDVFF